MSGHTVYAVASGKGGVGKTTTAIALAAAFADDGERTIVVDADLGMANVDAFLEIEPGPTTLHDVLSGSADPSEAIVESADGFDVLPSGAALDGYANIDIEELGDAVSDLADSYDRVLLDVGGGLSHESVLAVGLADIVLLVSTPDVAAVRDTKKTREIAERVDRPVGGVVVTRTGISTKWDPDEIADELESDLLASIPDDPTVDEALLAGSSIVHHSPDAPAARAYRELAATLAGGSVSRESAPSSAAPDEEDISPPEIDIELPDPDEIGGPEGGITNADGTDDGAASADEDDGVEPSSDDESSEITIDLPDPTRDDDGRSDSGGEPPVIDLDLPDSDDEGDDPNVDGADGDSNVGGEDGDSNVDDAPSEITLDLPDPDETNSESELDDSLPEIELELPNPDESTDIVEPDDPAEVGLVSSTPDAESGSASDDSPPEIDLSLPDPTDESEQPSNEDERGRSYPNPEAFLAVAEGSSDPPTVATAADDHVPFCEDADGRLLDRLFG